jgi:AbrB family looped-hinge helix DNA binding protein
MPIGKLGQRRQVVIPKDICDALGLNIGDYVEVNQVKGTVVIKPKKLVDADEVLTPEEEVAVAKGEAELRQRKSRPWSQIRPRSWDRPLSATQDNDLTRLPGVKSDKYHFIK